jgi:CubicO group peptidase (beta-lactamase class C family)
MAPAGQLWTTVEDLAKWAAFLGGDTGDVLARDTLDEMLEPHVVGDNPGQPWTSAHGLGWQVWNLDGRRLAGHGGSMPGFLAGLRVDLEAGDGLVALTNSTAGPFGPQVAPLLTEFMEREPKSAEPWHATGDPAVLELVGMWHWGPAVTVAKVVGEHLVLGEPGEGRGARFERVGPDEWVGLDGYHTGEPLRIIRRGDGTVSHLDLASFRFTRTPYDPGADVPGGVDEAGWR